MPVLYLVIFRANARARHTNACRVAREAGIMLIIDGSGVNVVTRYPELIKVSSCEDDEF